MKERYQLITSQSDNISNLFKFVHHVCFQAHFGRWNQAKHKLRHNLMMIFLYFNHIYDEPYTNNRVDLQTYLRYH